MAEITFYFLIATLSASEVVSNPVTNTKKELTTQPNITILEDDYIPNDYNNITEILIDNRSTEISEVKDLTRNEKFTNSRRFFTWLENLLKGKKKKAPDTKPTTGPELIHTTTVVPDLIPQDAQKFLLAILMSLTQSIEKLNNNIDFLLKSMTVLPLQQNNLRSKYQKNPNQRANNFHIDEDYFTLPIDNFGIYGRVKRQAPSFNVTERPVDYKGSYEATSNATIAEKKFFTNVTLDGNNTAVLDNTTETETTTSTPLIKNTTTQRNTDELNDKCKPPDGRRSLQYSNPEVKRKLLTYTEDTFNDINKKIASVNKMKYEYINNEYYKIGYIVANIDTLEANIANLRADVQKHKDNMDENKLIELFDKLIVSNKVVTTLVESLNTMVMKRNRAINQNQMPNVLPKERQEMLMQYRGA